MQSEELCGCIPWNYPHFSSDILTCDYMGARCFEKVMSNTELIKQCNCPYDCDATRYTYSVSSTKLDFQKLCQRDMEFEKILGETTFGLPNSFIRNFEKFYDGTDINEPDICEAALQNIAIAQFQLTSQIVTQIKRDIRVTFADYISNFGKELSELFCHISSFSFEKVDSWDCFLE